MSDMKNTGQENKTQGFRMERGIGGGSGEKAKNFKETMKTLLTYVDPYKWRIVFVFVFAVAGTLFTVVGPRILGMATTQIFDGILSKLSGRGGINFKAIGTIITVLVVLYLFSALFSYIQGFIMAGIAQDISYSMRKALSEKVNRMPLSYFDSRTHGEVLSRITNDVDTVSNTLNQSLSQIVSTVVTIAGIIIMMFMINWIMTVTALLILPFTFLLTSILIKKSQKYFKDQQEYLASVNGHVEEMYGGHMVIKAFNREKESVAVFSGYNKNLYVSAWKSEFLSGMMMPVAIFIGNLGYVVVTILGAWLTIRNAITIGDIQAFIQYVRLFSQPISQTAQIANVMQSTAAAAERVFEFLDEEEEYPDPSIPAVLKTVQGFVSFEHIHFGYVPEKTIINDFSSDAKPGQRIAIVGPTGAGKTTMVKLLMRFYDVNSGSIRVDDVDIRKMRRDNLRDIFGMVLQDTWLFNGTIMDNIRYGRLEAADEEVIAAAKAANADAFIRTLPGGYNMILNEDSSNVSQGEKQLLTIARAILSQPYMLILDEATSSVDTRTEILIKRAMETLMEGKTSFIIAHRLSTIRDADLILVMRGGDIVEQGTHTELLAKNGFYNELYNSQFAPV